MIIHELPAIDAAIDEESWEWLQDALPALAMALATEVRRGVGAEEIRRHVMQRTQRPALAMRCSQAAQHLASNGNQGE